MNLFKSFLSVLFVSSLIVSPMLSFAATAPTGEAVLVSMVNIEDARILSQEGNTVTVAFSITNGTGLQSGVKYGLSLAADGTTYAADEKVYDESLVLAENSTTKREVTYTAPATLGGSFNLILGASNENNFPFGAVSLGKVTLTASQKGVLIDTKSCYLQVGRDVNGSTYATKGNPHYTLTENIDISKTESIKMTCTVTNNTAKDQTLTPFFETRYYNAYGMTAVQTGGDYTPGTWKSGEKKTITLNVPNGTVSQFYSLKFSLMNADTASNAVTAKYVIRGTNASLQKVSLDHDYYASGDKGELSVLWSATYGNFARSGVKNAQAPTVTLKATITSKNGVACVAPIDQKLVRASGSPLSIISFEAKATCTNPKVSATLTDASGTVLDQKDFTFMTTGEHGPQPLSTKSMVMLIVVLLVLLGLGLALKNKRKNNATL